MLSSPSVAGDEVDHERLRRNSTVKPDIAVSPAQAQTIVDRLGAGQTVARISKLQGGAIGAIYEIGLIGWRASLVLKVYPESLHWKMQKEVNVCALLSGRLGVPVPRVLLADDTKSVIGLNFVLMNKLDGAVLRTLEPALPDTELFSAYSQMGQVLRQIHRISMPGFGYIGPNGIWTAHASNRAYMSSQFETKLAEFAERGGDPALGDRLRAVVIERAVLCWMRAPRRISATTIFTPATSWPREMTDRCVCRAFSTSKARLPAIP